jgi:hypothetical protein
MAALSMPLSLRELPVQSVAFARGGVRLTLEPGDAATAPSAQEQRRTELRAPKDPVRHVNHLLKSGQLSQSKHQRSCGADEKFSTWSFWCLKI